MLLNHARIYEAMWAIYSFAFHAGRHINVCIHDDGTLTEQGYASLRKLFPGIRIIDRPTADREVSNLLRRRGLPRSEVFRRDLVLSLKLFDPVILRRSRQIVVIDSDVLFFSPPTQLLESADRGANAFSVDFGYSNGYCANLVRIVYPGSEVFPLNSGILTFQAESFSLEGIEAHLECPLLWDHGMPHSLAEQAVYGLAFHSLNAEPLSERYQIVGRKLQFDQVDAVHFCASAPRRKLFYSHGIRHIAHQIGLR
jgi:hypothetical protein